MLTISQREELRARLTAHCETANEHRVVDAIVSVMEQIDDTESMVAFVVHAQTHDLGFRTMLGLLARTYIGQVDPRHRLTHTHIVPGPGVDMAAVAADRHMPVAREVVLALAQGRPERAWQLIDDSTTGLDARERIARRSAVLGFILSWLHERAVQNFPDVLV